jgi:hypothetical protein
MNSSLTPRTWLRSLWISGLLLPASLGIAQPAPSPAAPATLPVAVPKPVGLLAGRPDAEPQTELLGQRYENKAAGISFRPPIGSQPTTKPSDDQVAEYHDDARGWLLRVSKPTFPTPVPLTEDKKDGKERAGLLETTVQKLKLATPGAQVLRQDVINVDATYVGIIAMRFSVGTQRYLRQQAIVQANEQLYYIVTLTTGAGKLPAEGAAVDSLPPDPAEKLAVESFMALVDSIKLLDRAAIKEDQNQRLFRTRSLFLYWTAAKFDAIKIEKQYLRYVLDGKEVGYSYIEEMDNNPKLTGVDGPGAVVYERSHRVGKDEQDRTIFVDTGSFKFMSFDRTREAWTRIIVLQTQTAAGLEETHTAEFADSKQEQKMMLSPEGGVLPKEEKPDTRAPLMRPVTSRVLNVRVSGKGDNAEPIHMDLPPFYLPAAGQHFLPRLVVERAFRGPRTYLFASYIPETQDVRMRYVDVSEEKEVMFAGQRVRAIVVSERLGLEGNPTLHYVTAAGQYLGSENKANKLLILPSDEASILKLWPDAKLTRPDKMRHEGKPALSDLPQDPAPVRGLAPEIR